MQQSKRAGADYRHGFRFLRARHFICMNYAGERFEQRRFFERLAAFNRLILFDSRGTGLSDRILDAYTLERRELADSSST